MFLGWTDMSRSLGRRVVALLPDEEAKLRFRKGAAASYFRILGGAVF